MQRRLVALVLGLLIGGALATKASAEQAGGTVTGTVTATPTKYAAGVVVHLVGTKGAPRPSGTAVMDQKGMRFIPHVLAIIKGTAVDFLNSDSVRHNVFSPDGERMNLGTWPQGQTKTYTFTKTGVYRLLCNVHPEMSAFIVVLDTPHFAVTERDGAFQLQNVPAGTHTVRAWSEKLGEVTMPVTVSSGGTAELDIVLKRRR
jgi:plastocyanin